MNELTRTDQETDVAFLPTYECVISVVPLKRTNNMLHMRGAVFSKVWDQLEKDEDQSLVDEWGWNFERNSKTHLLAAIEVIKTVWGLIEDREIQNMRFSTGKYVDDNGNRKYDNFIDVNVGGLFRTERKDLLIQLIGKMLQVTRHFKHFNKEIEDENQIRPILPESTGCRALPSEV